MVFLKLNKNDMPQAINLIAQSGLSTEDLNQKNQMLFALKDNKDMVATCGLELYDKVALLRSFAVIESHRNTGLGKQIYSEILQEAVNLRIETLYLLTTTAEKFFTRHAWSAIKREMMPESIKLSKEFSSICPSSAVCMYINLK